MTLSTEDLKIYSDYQAVLKELADAENKVAELQPKYREALNALNQSLLKKPKSE